MTKLVKEESPKMNRRSGQRPHYLAEAALRKDLPPEGWLQMVLGQDLAENHKDLLDGILDVLAGSTACTKCPTGRPLSAMLQALRLDAPSGCGAGLGRRSAVSPLRLHIFTDACKLTKARECLYALQAVPSSLYELHSRIDTDEHLKAVCIRMRVCTSRHPVTFHSVWSRGEVQRAVAPILRRERVQLVLLLFRIGS